MTGEAAVANIRRKVREDEGKLQDQVNRLQARLQREPTAAAKV